MTTEKQLAMCCCFVIAAPPVPSASSLAEAAEKRQSMYSIDREFVPYASRSVESNMSTMRLS